MSLVLGRTRSDLDTMHRLDTRRFDSSDFPPFYQSYPPPMIAPSGIYGGRMEYTETPLWKDRKEERKLYTKYQSEYSPKLFQPYGNLDFNERDRTINDKVELRAFHDSTEKRFPNPGLMLELDLTTSQRHSMEMHSPISPSEYFYRRRDILSNGSSSHSTSPVSPFSGEVTASKPKYASSVKNNNGSHSPASHGMMDKNEEGVINLSTTKDVALDNRMNGDISHNGGHKEAFQERLLSSPTESGSSKMTNGSPDSLSNGVAAKRKSKCNSTVDLGTASQPLMMMAAQQGMLQQHVQQMMQGQGLSSPAVQQLLQHQTMLQHQQQQKLQEQVLHELNEQLQMNVIQQTQLMQQQQTDKAKGSNKQQLQHLSLQQQQLVQQIQQIQLQQRQYLLACLVNPYSVSQGMMLPPELQQLWKEVASQTGADTENGKGSFKGLGSLASTPTTQSNPAWTANGHSSSYLPHGMIGQPPVSVNLDDVERKNSILYRHGVCKWPGCDIACDDLASFQKHLDVEHQLDDRSTAQARVQMQVVSQLEIQLTREKDLLQGMMLHLHMKKPTEPKVEVSHAQKLASHKISSPVSPVSMATLHSAPTSPPRHGTTLSSPLKMQLNMTSISSVSAPPTPVSLVSNPLSLPLGIAPSLSTSMSKPPTPMSQSSASQPSTPTCGGGPMRRRVSDKCNLPISSGTSEEIQRNRDFYKSTDVRPPFTYASLIRQAIIESPHKQLTLNEIYQWFQTTFAYFRRNEATWKNAVRHNLSLHKCFMRVENVKGAVWTVDEVEFYKRRPQKLGGSMSMKDVKSPIIPTDPSMFGENLNASLRAALEQANLLNHHYSNGSVSMDGVEDLSMKSSRNSSSDSFNKGDSPSQDEFPDIKEEEEDHHDNNEEAFLGQSQMELRAIPESDNQTDDMAESTPSLTESTHSASASLDRQVGLQHSVGIYTDIQCTLREEEPPESDCSEQYSNVDMYLPSQGETMNSEESDPLGS